MEVNMTVGQPFRFPFNHFVKVRHLFPARGKPPVGGQYVHFGSGHTIDLGRRAQLALNGEAIYDNGVLGLNRAVLGRGVVTLKVPVGKFTLDLPALRVTLPLKKFGPSPDARGFEWTVGTGLSYSFAP